MRQAENHFLSDTADVPMGVPAIRTTASRRDHAFMQFFDRAGFELSLYLVVACAEATPHEGTPRGEMRQALWELALRLPGNASASVRK